METRTVWLWEEDYPSTLSAEELEDPLLVGKRFFQQYSLTEVQGYLWEWLPLFFTDAVIITPEKRLILYNLHQELKRLLDMAFVLSRQMNQKRRTLSFDQETQIKARELGRIGVISYLSFHEIRRPDLVLKTFFDHHDLRIWHLLFLRDWNEALFNEGFWCTNSFKELSEINELLDLTRLIEATYLLTLGSSTYEHSHDDLSIWFSKLDPLVWGEKYYQDNTIVDSLQSIAFLYYHKYGYTTWCAAYGFYIINQYDKLRRLIILASYITDLKIDENRVMEDIRAKLEKFLKTNEVGKLIRFLNSCLLGDLRWDERVKNETKDRLKINQIENLLHLLFAYYKELKN